MLSGPVGFTWWQCHSSLSTANPIFGQAQAGQCQKWCWVKFASTLSKNKTEPQIPWPKFPKGGDAACSPLLLCSHAMPLVMTAPATAGTEKQKLLAQMEQHQRPKNLSQILVSKCPDGTNKDFVQLTLAVKLLSGPVEGNIALASLNKGIEAPAREQSCCLQGKALSLGTRWQFLLHKNQPPVCPASGVPAPPCGTPHWLNTSLLEKLMLLNRHHSPRLLHRERQRCSRVKQILCKYQSSYNFCCFPHQKLNSALKNFPVLHLLQVMCK